MTLPTGPPILTRLSRGLPAEPTQHVCYCLPCPPTPSGATLPGPSLALSREGLWEGSSQLPLAGHRVHPQQQAALCLKGTQPLSWLASDGVQHPPHPQPEPGQGIFEDGTPGASPRVPGQTDPWGPAVLLTCPGTLLSDYPPQTSVFPSGKWEQCLPNFFKVVNFNRIMHRIPRT